MKIMTACLSRLLKAKVYLHTLLVLILYSSGWYSYVLLRLLVFSRHYLYLLFVQTAFAIWSHEYSKKEEQEQVIEQNNKYYEPSKRFLRADDAYFIIVPKLMGHRKSSGSVCREIENNAEQLIKMAKIRKNRK